MAKANTVAAADIFPMSDARVVTRAALPSVDLGELFSGEVADLRTFSSGKQGYGFYGKLKVGAKRVQCSVNLVILEDKA